VIISHVFHMPKCSNISHYVAGMAGRQSVSAACLQYQLPEALASPLVNRRVRRCLGTADHRNRTIASGC
jgi:hypothetical protein